MSKLLTTKSEDVLLDAAFLEEYFDDDCHWLIALTDWQLAVILSLTRYAHWERRWQNYTDFPSIWQKVQRLEHCLLMGCDVSELLTKFDTLNGYMLTLINRLVTPGGDNIAEVVSELELTCGDTEVNFDTAAIADAIEAQTTMQETRSIAETTAQNTNFDDLITAIEALELEANCSPDVNLTCSPDVIVNVGGGGEGAGTQPPSDPGEEGGDPPIGWEEPPETTYDRKCRVANHIWDDLYSVIDQFNNANLENIISTLGISAGVGIVMAALAAITGPVGFALVVVGVVVGVILAFIVQSVDLDNLKSIMTTNKEDLICALYNSTEAQAAIDDFIQVLTDGGANTAQTVLVQAIFIIDVANSLFFAKDDAAGQALEAELDGYEGSVDCAVCYEQCGMYIEIGALNEQNGNQYEFSSEPSSGAHELSVFFNATGFNQYCGPSVLFDFLSSNPSPLTKYGSNLIYRIVEQGGGYAYTGDTPWSGNECGGRLQVISNVSFTVTVAINGEC